VQFSGGKFEEKEKNEQVRYGIVVVRSPGDIHKIGLNFSLTWGGFYRRLLCIP
jgi:hypothetical protein